MAKKLNLTIKNAQIAQAIDLDNIKAKLAGKKEPSPKEKPAGAKPKKSAKEPAVEAPKEEQPRVKARSRSAFADPQAQEAHAKELFAAPAEPPEYETEEVFSQEAEPEQEEAVPPTPFAEEAPVEEIPIQAEEPLFVQQEVSKEPEVSPPEPVKIVEQVKPESVVEKAPAPQAPQEALKPRKARPSQPLFKDVFIEKKADPAGMAKLQASSKERLGPTGKHISDFIKPKPVPPPSKEAPKTSAGQRPGTNTPSTQRPFKKEGVSGGPVQEKPAAVDEDEDKKNTRSKTKEFRDLKPAKKPATSTTFDARDRLGLRNTEGDEGASWRRRKAPKHQKKLQEETVRPTSLNVRLPTSIKDLASEMKLKASQLISHLFLQGMVVTLNDLLDDETTIQLLGQEFGCEISIDRAEEKRIQITDKTIKEEIASTSEENLITRPPVVAFMGHVDHGKTSLIDSIRKSNRASGEAGAITQHIGAFCCHTAVGDITILDTPGHEAFSAMRARGADATDIVVLVVAGDEGIKQQTVEALQHAKAAKVTIVVAINKCDKPSFNAETVYRQLADNELLPEVWGGQTITINCSAVTGEGVQTLLEMLALQAEVLELKANPASRARGTVLESEMHKGMGTVATVLVQNGTLKKGDSVVFNNLWGKVKTMQNEFGQELEKAGPSTPVKITGLSGLPAAGHEFIVVENEKEAREIAEVRAMGQKQDLQLAARRSLEHMLQQGPDSNKKILNIVLRADVQGSLEALRTALQKIESAKVDLNVIFSGVGEISESDIQLAAASKAVVVGFHSAIEKHAESIVKQLGVQVKLHDIIYHAIDDVRDLMTGQLDKIAQETPRGKAEVRATFKSSQVGLIAGCQVIEGPVNRGHHARLKRGDVVLWKGSISSLKRVKEDVREVQKGMECGILLNGTTDVQAGDIIETYEVTYLKQEL